MSNTDGYLFEVTKIHFFLMHNSSPNQKQQRIRNEINYAPKHYILLTEISFILITARVA